MGQSGPTKQIYDYLLEQLEHVHVIEGNHHSKILQKWKPSSKLHLIT